MAEISLIVEFVYVLSQGLYMFRTLYHAKVSKEAGQSITPILYWVLTIGSSVLIGFYGFLIGSVAMPLFAVLGIPFSLYHMKIEKERVEVEKEGLGVDWC